MTFFCYISNNNAHQKKKSANVSAINRLFLWFLLINFVQVLFLVISLIIPPEKKRSTTHSKWMVSLMEALNQMYCYNSNVSFADNSKQEKRRKNHCGLHTHIPLTRNSIDLNQLSLYQLLFDFGFYDYFDVSVFFFLVFKDACYFGQIGSYLAVRFVLIRYICRNRYSVAAPKALSIPHITLSTYFAVFVTLFASKWYHNPLSYEVRMNPRCTINNEINNDEIRFLWRCYSVISSDSTAIASELRYTP